MVEASEEAWRILSRRNAQLCFTPMFHARLFSDPDTGPKYRAEQWTTNPNDRPLIVQVRPPPFFFDTTSHPLLFFIVSFVPMILIHFYEQLDLWKTIAMVDLNLGCPQHIARKGHYGSYLQDDWDLIERMIQTLDRHCAVPVTVKMRIHREVERTIAYAQMIERAGAQMLTVHGRLREQKGHHTGLADWTQIKAVEEAVNIPVIANGNILYHQDIQRCMDQTGVDGVMIAEGSLYNPALFALSNPTHMPPCTWEMALEYLDICQPLGVRPAIIKAHLFKLFQPSLSLHTDLRARLATANNWDAFYDIAVTMKGRLVADQAAIGETELNGKENEHGIRQYGHWRCQPYFRPALPDNGHHVKKTDTKRDPSSDLSK
ncbi:unnamed protein product [Absidia cylindrospora]